MSLFDKPKKKQRRLRAGDRVIVVVPERRYAATVSGPYGADTQTFLVRPDGLKCYTSVERVNMRYKKSLNKRK